MGRRNANVSPSATLEHISRCMSRMRYILNDRHCGAVGVSAPQVGFNYNIIGIRRPVRGDQALLLLNPRVVKYLGGWQNVEEGCLSHLGSKYMVRRREALLLRAIVSPERRYVDILFRGLEAAIVQHEMDHLRGRRWPR